MNKYYELNKDLDTCTIIVSSLGYGKCFYEIKRLRKLYENKIKDLQKKAELAEQLQITANECKQDYQRMKENFDSKVDAIATLTEEKKHLENEVTNLKQQNQMITEQGEHYKHLYSEVKKQKADVVECLKELSDNTDDTTCYEIDRNSRNDLLRMLGEI